MSFNVQVIFDDGEIATYDNVPDNVTPDQIAERASKKAGVAVASIFRPDLNKTYGKPAPDVTQPIAKTQYGTKPITGMQVEAEEQYPDIYSTSSPQYAKGFVKPDTGVIGKTAEQTLMTTEAALGSLPASTWKMMTGLADMVEAVFADPQKAGESAMDVAKGLYGLTMQKVGKKTTVSPEQMTKAAEFAKSMTDKYSSPEKFRQAFMEDPAPILADATMIAPVGTGLVKGIAKVSAPIAKVVANTGEALKSAAAQGLMKSAREQVRVAADFPKMDLDLMKRRQDFILSEKLDATLASRERIKSTKSDLIALRNEVSAPIENAPTRLENIFKDVIPEEPIIGIDTEMKKVYDALNDIDRTFAQKINKAVSQGIISERAVPFKELEKYQTRLNEYLASHYKAVEKGRPSELTPTTEKLLVNIRDNISDELRRVAGEEYGTINKKLSNYIDIEPIISTAEQNASKARKSILEESIKILAGGAGTGAVVGGVPGAEIGALAGVGTSALLWLVTKPSAPFTRARMKLAIARATDSEIDNAYKMSEKLFTVPESKLTPKENALKTKVTQIVDFLKNERGAIGKELIEAKPTKFEPNRKASFDAGIKINNLLHEKKMPSQDLIDTASLHGVGSAKVARDFIAQGIPVPEKIMNQVKNAPLEDKRQVFTAFARTGMPVAEAKKTMANFGIDVNFPEKRTWRIKGKEISENVPLASKGTLEKYDRMWKETLVKRRQLK